MKLPLILGIKRSRFRAQDPRRARADAEFAAKRPAVVAKGKSTCLACSYQARTAGHMDVHHLDDDHHNNADSNLALACHTCHPYQHVGELVRRSDTSDVPGGEGLGSRTRVAAVPEVDASDLNLLQRAIGVALLDERLAPVAQEMMRRLAGRAQFVRADMGTCMPADFAAAMAQLDDEQYTHRVDAVEDLRIIFNDDMLKKLGRQFVADYPSLPPSSWPALAQGAKRGRAA